MCIRDRFGWSGAVNRVLGRLEGVTKVDIDLPGHKVFVETTLTSDEVFAAIKKTGREVTFIGVKK